MRRAAVALTLVTLTGCLDSLFESLPQEPPFPTGASFAFTSTTYRLDTLQIGTIVVLAADSGRFTGTWELAWAAAADSTPFPGLISGQGTLRGSIQGSQASIILFSADTTRRILLGAFADTVGWHGGWNYERDSLRLRGGRFTARMFP